jgi:CheY-like chemotaxis protein
MVEPQSEAKGLTFSWTKNTDLPRWVLADGKRLRQILLNLLANAVRFTEAGGMVRLEASWADGHVNFDVIDTGVGVLPQDQQRIFLPFERGSAGRQSGEPGTGLGLAISLQLSALMDGELTLVESSNTGSVFRLRLQLESVADPGVRLAPPKQISGYSGKRRKLLIVDDHAVHRQMLAGMLAPLGFKLREAASGTESLDILQSYRPDAILLDITMDDMSGWEVATNIRARGLTSVPIIIVSANAFENDPELLEQFQCQAFLVKPVSDSQLLQALERFLLIEWKENERPSVDIGPPVLSVREKFPDQVVSDLLKMLRLGHVKGLLDLLEDTSIAHPDLLASCAQFRIMVARFELEKMEQLLQHHMEAQ